MSGDDAARVDALLWKVADAVERLVKRSPHEAFAEVIGMGADGTPTKMVDDLAEAEMMRIVEESDVPVNVLSEELGFVDRGADRVLVADPIDGTTNAARGIPLYCISLAVGSARLSDVEVGLVRNIPTGDTYFVRRGEGATLNGRPLATRAFEPENAAVSPVLGEHAKPESLHLAAKQYNVRAMGSAALEMCFVAQGALDLYYFAPERLRITDIAASTLAVREAGGKVLNAQGKELDIELSLEPRTSVVAASGGAALEMLEVFH